MPANDSPIQLELDGATHDGLWSSYVQMMNRIAQEERESEDRRFQISDGPVTKALKAGRRTA